MFTLLLVIRTQRHVWSLDKVERTTKSSQQSFAIDGKTYIII